MSQNTYSKGPCVKYLIAAITILLNCATGYAMQNDDDFYQRFLSEDFFENEKIEENDNTYKQYKQIEDHRELNNPCVTYRNDYIHFISSDDGTLKEVIVKKSWPPVDIDSLIPRYLLNQDNAVHNTPTTKYPAVAPATHPLITPIAATLAMQGQIKENRAEPTIVNGKSYWAPIEGCNQKYEIKRSFHRHITHASHTRYLDKKFACPQCGKKYSDKYYLTDHKMNWCKKRISSESNNNNNS